MRLPLSKVYRAFPELDRFGDEECERYVREARRHHGLSEIAVGAGAVVASLVSCAVLAGATGAIFRNGPRSWQTSVWWELAGVLLLVVSISGGAMVGFVIRDCWLRWALKTRLSAAKCSRCGYSLLGLPVRAGIVICPECGLDLPLAKLGLTLADILAPADVHPTSASPSDSP